MMHRHHHHLAADSVHPRNRAQKVQSPCQTSLVLATLKIEKALLQYCAPLQQAGGALGTPERRKVSFSVISSPHPSFPCARQMLQAAQKHPTKSTPEPTSCWEEGVAGKGRCMPPRRCRAAWRWPGRSKPSCRQHRRLPSPRTFVQYPFPCLRVLRRWP